MSQGEAGYRISYVVRECCTCQRGRLDTESVCSERMLHMSEGEAGYRVSYVVRECCTCHRGRLDTE